MGDSSRPFKILEILATGTFGIVCVAHDVRSGKLRALKVLHSRHVGRKDITARARDEARLLGEFEHPNIVRLHEFLEVTQRPVLVMEWVRGVHLGKLIQDHPTGLPVDVAIELTRQIACALDAAWNTPPRGGGNPMHIIHRDLKPTNVLLSIDGSLKVVDFGIAKGHIPRREADTLSMVLGARGYLAPERLDGAPDAMSGDTYALGVVFHQLLTGETLDMSLHPEQHQEGLAKVLRSLNPEQLRGPALQTLRGLLASMCAYTPQDRPKHATVVQRLEQIQSAIGREPSLKSFARSAVLPLFLTRNPQPPSTRREYSEVSFLEKELPPRPQWAIPNVDPIVEEHLRKGMWRTEPEALKILLLCHPHWSPNPFLSSLPRAPSSPWRFWQKTTSARDITQLLRFLTPRAQHPDVRRRALALSGHSDPGVRAAARDLLDIDVA